MRLITRPDFDGIVCAVLLGDVLDIHEPIAWIEPYELMDNVNIVKKGDIIANLPHIEGCTLWFDHHFSNMTDKKFEGAFAIAPSAARVIYDYYKGAFSKDFAELVTVTDKIDSANFTLDEVLNPENHQYIMLYNTISGSNKADEKYWNKVVDLLSTSSISTLMRDAEVKKKCVQALAQDKSSGKILKEYTVRKENITITDFRPLSIEPKVNRFMVYSLFPDSLMNIKIRYDKTNRDRVIISLGRNIFNRLSKVHLGHLVAQYGGGGHEGAGSCHFHADGADEKINEIIKVLTDNVAVH